MVLHLVMAVQLAEEQLQAAGEGRCEVFDRAAPPAEGVDILLQGLAQLAEGRVTVEPKPRRRAEPGMAGPAAARMLLQEETQFGRPALAMVQAESGRGGWDFRIHERYPGQ